jgi:hypothetical protein
MFTIAAEVYKVYDKKWMSIFSEAAGDLSSK